MSKLFVEYKNASGVTSLIEADFDDVAEHVLSSPEALWRVLESGKQVAGPWAPERMHGVKYTTALERLPPGCGPRRDLENWPLAHVMRSSQPREPETHQFYTYDGEESYFHDEEYEAAVAEHAKLMEIWEAWSWRAGEATGYGPTREEAAQRADESLALQGILVIGTLPAELHGDHRFTNATLVR